MEVIIANLYVCTPLLEGLLEVAVHVAADGLHILHPLLPDEVDEVEDNLLPLASGKVEHMSGLHADDYRCILVAVMELELVDPDGTGLLIRDLPASVFPAVELLESFLVDLLHDIPSQPCDPRHLLVGESKEKEVPAIGPELAGDPVAFSLEGHFLDHLGSTGLTFIAPLLEAHRTEVPSEGDVPEGDVIDVMGMHPSATLLADEWFWWGEDPFDEIDASFIDGDADCGSCVLEPFQK